ncbi:MAG: hypothetical protein J3Q66DRAFT_342099 [Benniella sp.]|nr:MAG: hypothetical protein J3Q66DRAFT_342099 [Benniella sp.]
MENTAPLKVLIVGADVATLTLALLLEQSNMDYLLLESSDSVPVVAGGITLHPTVLPLLEQLSLRDDLLFFSQPLEQAGIQDSDMDDICSYDWSDRQTRFGTWSRFMSRPEYCNMILERLPESKILFNKTVISVSTLEDEDDHVETKAEPGPGEARGVTVECADGTVYHGQLLVGDINSDVERKLLYVSEPQRKETINTATSSRKDMREVHYHVSGITEAVDPQRIPLLKEDTTQLRLVLDSKSSLSWWVATLADHRIAWQVTKRVVYSDKSSRTPDLGPFQHEQAAMDAVLSHVNQNMICPLGSNMAKILEWTPPSQISCKRWDDKRVPSFSSSSRILLLGEACHKIVPVLGQAADESILDAMALCEALFDMPSLNLRDIQQAFHRYRKERTSRREAAIDEARSLDQILNAKGALRRLYRSAALNLPRWVQDRKYDEKYSYRPQASFLDRVPDYGRIQPNASSYPKGYSDVERERY